MWEMFEKVWMNGGRVGWGQEWNCWAIIGDPAETVSLSISDLWAHLSWVSVAVLSNFCSLCLDVEEQFWEVCSLGYWTESVLTVICSCSRRGFVFLACHAPAIDSLTQCLLWTHSSHTVLLFSKKVVLWEKKYGHGITLIGFTGLTVCSASRNR